MGFIVKNCLHGRQFLCLIALSNHQFAKRLSRILNNYKELHKKFFYFI